MTSALSLADVPRVNWPRHARLRRGQRGRAHNPGPATGPAHAQTRGAAPHKTPYTSTRGPSPLAQAAYMPARGSAPVERPSACAISSAIARWMATESFWTVNECHVRAAQVVSSYPWFTRSKQTNFSGRYRTYDGRMSFRLGHHRKERVRVTLERYKKHHLRLPWRLPTARKRGCS